MSGGHVAVVAWLVECHGVPVEAGNKENRTALMWAVRNCQLALASWLVDRGARPDAVTKTGTNLLHWAIWSGQVRAVEWVLAQVIQTVLVGVAGSSQPRWPTARMFDWLHVYI